ncbi:hypothetical protein Pmani_033479 [Petrolisthes manimaculis]|uniref:Protein lin-10 n=1 Tax=Petrolisthes manimaculis TaxID=1843537 RepID=A0AAE1TQM3_9EUCA|nr:hypothetical protein Pmani_033479 [Petrolisthes manimaculis]
MVALTEGRSSDWRRPKTRTVMPRATNHKANGGGATSNGSTPTTPIGQQGSTNQEPPSSPDMASSNKNKNKKEKETGKKKGRSKEVMIHEPAVLIEGVLFRARYLGSTQLVSEGQPTKTTRMMQAEEAVSRIKLPLSLFTIFADDFGYLSVAVAREPTKTTFPCQDADDEKEALVESNNPEQPPPPGPPYSPSPKHSPLPHHQHHHQHHHHHHSPSDLPSLGDFSPRSQASPMSVSSPTESKSSSKLASPMAGGSGILTRTSLSPHTTTSYSHTGSDNQSSPLNAPWKPPPRASLQGLPQCPYAGDVILGHSGLSLVAPMEDTGRRLENVTQARKKLTGVACDEYEIEDNDDDDDEDEDENNEEEEEEEEETEGEDKEEEDCKLLRSGDDDEEEEDEDEEEDNEGSKSESGESEDPCIEVLTVIPGSSGTQQHHSRRREEDHDDEDGSIRGGGGGGGGGGLDWVSEEGGGPGLGPAGTVFHLRLVGSIDVAEESGKTPSRKTAGKRPKKDMVMEAVSHLKVGHNLVTRTGLECKLAVGEAPDGESQPSTEVDLFISTEKIMVLNTDLKEIMMDHALRTISYIADIGDLVVLMARRRVLPTDDAAAALQKTPKMICHVFESDEAQFIAQSIGQAFQVAYLEFLKANGIEDHSFVKEMDYQEVLNSQEIFGDELQMFAKKELQKEVVVPKMKSEILGVVVVESGWGSMVPTVVIANLSPTGAAAKCGQLNIGDQIIAINGVSLVGLPLSTCQNYIKNTKYNTAVKLTVVPCPPVVEVKIRRPDTKYQLGFSVQNGVICSLLRGGIAERGGVRVGHRIIDINSQSVVAVPHEKIVKLLATSVGEIRMKTMPTSIFRLLTGQETPQYI